VRDFQNTFGQDGILTPEHLLILHDAVMDVATGADWGKARNLGEKENVLCRLDGAIAATVPLAGAMLSVAPQLNIKVAVNAVDPQDFQHSRKPNDGIVMDPKSWTRRSLFLDGGRH
jgi:hypothetical protein